MKFSHPDPIQLLHHCAHERGVGNLQHRTIIEFAAFVEKVIWSDDDKYRKYHFDWTANNAIEIWITKFAAYRESVDK